MMQRHLLAGLGAGIAMFAIICVASLAWLAMRSIFGDQPAAFMIAFAVGVGIFAFFIDWATDKRGKSGED